MVCLVVAFFVSDLPERIREYFINPEEILKKTRWEWDRSKDFNFYRENLKPFRVDKIDLGKFASKFIFRSKDRELFRRRGPLGSPFVLAPQRNLILFVAYDSWSNGATLEAYSTSTGGLMWKTLLKGVGNIDHSKYSNRVQMRLEPPHYAIVFGNEMAGRYTEIVDTRTGQTVAHRKEIVEMIIK